MASLIELLTPFSYWHWLGIALVLLGIEAATGTFDLLWVSVAGFVTAAFTAFMPGLAGDWRVQFLFFFIASVVLIILGRTVFSGLRRVADEHPTLNKRMNSLVGQRGTVAGAFQSGLGRVKIGDTEWSAESVDGFDYAGGEAVIVDSVHGNAVKVRAA